MVFEYLKHRREANAIAHEIGEAAEDIAESATHHDRGDRR